MAKGFSSGESEELLKKSVEIACEARKIYYDKCTLLTFDGNENNKTVKRRPVLVAASIGSYGAYLADGSEYRCVVGCINCFKKYLWLWLVSASSQPNYAQLEGLFS